MHHATYHLICFKVIGTITLSCSCDQTFISLRRVGFCELERVNVVLWDGDNSCKVFAYEQVPMRKLWKNYYLLQFNPVMHKILNLFLFCLEECQYFLHFLVVK